MQKPRLCFVLPNYDPATGSHFFHLYQLLERAAKELDIFLIVEKTKLCPPFASYCQRFSFPPLRFLELLLVLTRERANGRRYFYVHYSIFGALASWFVTKFLGGVAYYWNCGMPWLYRRSFFEENIFRFVLRHTILVTGTANISAEYGSRYYLDQKNIRVLPNWIKIRRFDNACERDEIRKRLGIGADKKVVLFVHHLSRRKGAHFIIPVAKLVTERFQNVIFIVVGGGPEFEKLRPEVQRLESGRFIRLIGEVPNKEIEDYFSAADVFFMPSEEEGFPHVLIEAQAAGIPYVASDVGGVREITPPVLQSYIVSSGNVNDFADKIILLLNKPESEILSISKEEKEWVKKYDIKTVLSQFISLFKV